MKFNPKVMFFLGGLNTILPHLIYLSVIWAFLLIGMSGRFRFPISGQTDIQNHFSVKEISKTDDSHVVLTIDADISPEPVKIRNIHYKLFGLVAVTRVVWTFRNFPDLRAPPL